MNNTEGLGSLDPNVLPLDAIELQEESSTSKIIAGRDEWRFGSAISGSKWVTGREYKAGDIVWNPADKLTYVALVDNASIEPDYSDSGIEGVTWEWIAGVASGFVTNKGRWEKYPNGLLVQIYIETATNVAVTTSTGTALYRSAQRGNTDWPISFTSIDTAFWTIRHTTGSVWVSPDAASPSELTKTPYYFILAVVSRASIDVSLTCYGKGRWKA